MSLQALTNRLLKPHFFSRLKVMALQSSFLVKTFKLRYFSLNNLDMKMETYLDFNNGYFVELGANDGVNQSNTLYFEKFRGWHGVLIEPYLPNFNRLIRNRSSANFCKNAACVGPSYKDEKVTLAYSNLMTSTLGITSEIPNPVDHAVSGERFWGGKTFVFETYALTLNSILIEAKSPKTIDLLSIDVEGVELEILKGVNHSDFRFRFICVESRRFGVISQYLSEQDYVYVESLSPHDYLFQDIHSI
jgi:FkbM family methyltransferase